MRNDKEGCPEVGLMHKLGHFSLSRLNEHIQPTAELHFAPTTISKQHLSLELQVFLIVHYDIIYEHMRRVFPDQQDEPNAVLGALFCEGTLSTDVIYPAFCLLTIFLLHFGGNCSMLVFSLFTFANKFRKRKIQFFIFKNRPIPHLFAIQVIHQVRNITSHIRNFDCMTILFTAK